MRVVIEGVSGPGKGKTVSLRKDQVLTVGRTEWSDVSIESDAQISARHFTVEHNGEVVVLNDLQSTNGVRINGEDVQQAHLQDGDQISAGLTTFVVHISDTANQYTPLAPNPYPNAPRDPAHPDAYATGQAPVAPVQQPPAAPAHGSIQGGYSSPIGGPPNPPGNYPLQNPSPNIIQPSTPQSVGQSPIAGYDDFAQPANPDPSQPPQVNPAQIPPASIPPAQNPSEQGGSPISPIMYDGGSFSPPQQAPHPTSGVPAQQFQEHPQDFAPAPIQNSPISSPPPSAPEPQTPEGQRHIVPSQRQKVKAAGAGALNFSRHATKNDRVIYKGLVDQADEERDFAPSGLMALLGGMGPYLLITHHQRAGSDAPEYAPDATPLFDWMPPDTARGYSPIVIGGNEIDDPFNEIDELWDSDALIVVLVKDPEEAKKHLVELTKWNPFGVEQNTLFGYCWPKVLAQFIEHGDQEMADRTFDNLIIGFFFEDTNEEENWQLIADAEFGNKIESLGFVEVQQEEEHENAPLEPGAN